MSKDEGIKQLLCHVPTSFKDEWDQFIEDYSDRLTGLEKMTSRKASFNALKMYMDAKKQEWSQE